MKGKLKYNDDTNKWFVEFNGDKYEVVSEVDDSFLDANVEFELEQDLRKATRYTLDVPTYIVKDFKII